MNKFWAICAMLCASAGWAAEVSPPPATSIDGTVLETRDVASYTYLRLKTKDREIWAAIARAPVKVGAEVTIDNAMIMINFESKSLQKKFDRIIFGSLVGAGTDPTPAGGDLDALHAGIARAADAGAINVAKAAGPGAHTVAEIVTASNDLKNKTVLVRGKVVKYTPQVLGKNWIHLRDGSGSAGDNTNDILVATSDRAKIGDVVMVRGVVRTDRDLGSGYFYKVLIEAATLQK